MNNAHYPKKLLDDYELLLEHFPSHVICRPHMVNALVEWKHDYDPDGTINILEIGPGFGETTELILKKVPATFTLVEVDTKAADVLAENLKDFKKQISVVTEDATEWIKNQPIETYDVFTASWVIHNFPSDQREEFLADVARVLRPGGLFIIFDKILPDTQEEVDALWKIHTERLSNLDTIGRSELKKEMLDHEVRDSEPPYVWYEQQFKNSLEKLGFKHVRIVMRNDRDVVAAALK